MMQREDEAGAYTVCPSALFCSCSHRSAYAKNISEETFVCASSPRAHGWPSLKHLPPVRWAGSHTGITHFKENHCHTLMWQTAPLTSAHRAGGVGGVGGKERERDRERAVCSQAHGCANINHGDSHGIIKADHSQSQQRRTEEKSTNTNFRPRTHILIV